MVPGIHAELLQPTPGTARAEMASAIMGTFATAQLPPGCITAPAEAITATYRQARPLVGGLVVGLGQPSTEDLVDLVRTSHPYHIEVLLRRHALRSNDPGIGDRPRHL
jgi:hypothetical protein